MAGALRSLKPTSNVFSFAGKQDWACENLLRQGPGNATRAKLGHATPRTRSQKAPTELLGPAVCKGTGKAPRGANISPTAPLLRKAMQAVFEPSPPLDVGQSGAGLPLAPWALLLGWGSPEPETNSQRVLLRGEAGLGVRRPSAPRPQQCHPSQAGPDSPKPRLPNGTNRAPGGCSLKGDRKRSSGSTHQPQRDKTQESNKSHFRTQPPASSPAKRGWAAPGSLSPAALQGVFGA